MFASLNHFHFVAQVVDLNVNKKTVTLNDGTLVKYDKCLLATGGKPKNLRVVEDAGPNVAKHVTLFRNVRTSIRVCAVEDQIQTKTEEQEKQPTSCLQQTRRFALCSSSE